MTIKDLKDLIRNWPETNELGEDNEVWVETGWCCSSPAVSCGRLNQGDLIVNTNIYESPHALVPKLSKPIPPQLPSKKPSHIL